VDGKSDKQLHRKKQKNHTGIKAFVSNFGHGDTFSKHCEVFRFIAMQAFRPHVLTLSATEIRRYGWPKMTEMGILGSPGRCGGDVWCGAIFSKSNNQPCCVYVLLLLL